MRSRSALLLGLPLFGAVALATSFGGCSTTSTDVGGAIDGSSDAAAGSVDAGGGEDADSSPLADSATPAIDSTAVDSAVSDGGSDADARPPFVTALTIASAYGTPLRGAPGDAIPLVVVLTLSDGTTRKALAREVSWIAPPTLVAENPYAAGANILPEAGAQPTAFYIRNDYRQESPGTLFIVDRGSVASPQVTVTASVVDAGQASAVVSILPAPVGDADAGERLFRHVLLCSGCHGPTAGGTPPYVLADGGAVLLDGGPVYQLQGELYPYPAPGLNAVPGSGHLAADPEWSEAVFAMAAQSDMDNKGVALRKPMPTWVGGNNGTGNPVNAQNFADIYAWLLTQTQ